MLQEGVQIRGSLAPVEVVLDGGGRARALRVVEVDWIGGKMQPRSGSEFDIECDLIVAAVGQSGDFTGMQELDNGRGLMNVDGATALAGPSRHLRWRGRRAPAPADDRGRPRAHCRRNRSTVLSAESRRESGRRSTRITFDLLEELGRRGLDLERLRPSAGPRHG